MQNDNIQEKQKYLRQNILQSGYDPSDFITFLQQNQNIDHIDIEGWSMPKIQKLVTAYKQYKYYTAQENSPAQQNPTQEKKRIFTQKEQKHSKDNTQRKTLSDKSLPSTILLSTQGGKMVYEKQKMTLYQQQKSKIQYPRYNPIFDYEFTGKCKCVKAQNLLNDDLQVQVPRFQIVESAGFLSSFIGAKTQIWYVLKSNIKKETVVRRLMQDFDWLSTALIRLYPYIALPQLSEYRKQQQNPNEKRRIQIQEYLQAVCRRKQLYQSSLLYDFLTAHSDKMEKIKKSYDTMGFAKGVSLLKTETGEVQVEYTKRLRQFQEVCHQYSKKVYPIHQKFSQSLAKAVESMQLVVTNINVLVDYFAEIYQSYNQVMNKFPEHKSSQYNQILVNMNNLCLGLSQNIKGHATNLQKHLKDYFKVNILNDKNMIRLQKYVKEEEKIYLDYKYNLMRKKERLLTEPDKWDIDVKSLGTQVVNELKTNKEKAYEIMLPRETQQQHQIKSWVAYLYTRFAAEFGVYVREQTWRYASRYKLLAADLLANDKNYLEALTKFLSQSRKLVK